MLEYDSQYDGYRFFIPTNIFPRYGIEPENENAVDGAQVVSTVSQAGTYISVKLNSSKTSFLECVSHKELAKVKPDLVTYSSKEEPKLENDFVVIVKDQSHLELSAHLSSQDPVADAPVLSNLLTINFRPTLDLTSTRPKELIFLIDRSGSMDSCVETLKDALQLYLSSLPSSGQNNDYPIYFNFVSFGSKYKFLWPHSRLLNEQSFKDARTFIKSINADFGGTEILDPLVEILNQLKTPGYFRYLGLTNSKTIDHEIIVLTDGEVFNVSEIFKTLKKMVSSLNNEGNGITRVHSFGVGDSVSHSLLDSLAKAGGGIKQTVLVKERMELKISKLLQIILSPCVIGATVYWSLKDKEKKIDGEDEFEMLEGYGEPLSFKLGKLMEVDTYDKGHLITPNTGLLPIFSKNDSKMYIFVDDASLVAPSVKIQLLLDDGSTKTFEAPVVQDESYDNEKFLFVGGGRSLLRTFSDEKDAEENENEENEILQSTDKSKRDKFCELIGETFGLVSPWTSLLALENKIKDKNREFESDNDISNDSKLGENIIFESDFGSSYYLPLRMQCLQYLRSSPKPFNRSSAKIRSRIRSNNSYIVDKCAALTIPTTSTIDSMKDCLGRASNFVLKSVFLRNKQPEDNMNKQPEDNMNELSTSAPPLELPPKTLLETAYQDLSIITLACNFDGSFDVSTDLYQLLSPAHSQPPLSTIETSKNPKVQGYVALAVSVFLKALESRTKDSEIEFGSALILLLEKVNKYVDQAYGKDTQKLEQDRKTLEDLFKINN